MPFLIDNAAREVALTQWALPDCLHAPIAAVDAPLHGKGPMIGIRRIAPGIAGGNFLHDGVLYQPHLSEPHKQSTSFDDGFS